MKKLGIFIGFGLMLTVSFLLRQSSTHAVTGNDWQAGRIIDDGIFTNKDSMTVAEIQAFLNSKIGTGGYDSVSGQCDTFGTRNASPYNSGVSRAVYATSIGKPARWTCLNNYYEVPKTSPGPALPASNYGSDTIPAGAISAAQIIWNAAQQSNISPKVLLVTIQKESSGPLTTDDWPWQNQYNYAMGAHCPDSTGCDPNYAGFSIQIAESAALFRWYLDNMNQPWWSYKHIGNNSVLYNPNTGCGSSTVNITTMATAALYTYTPYQPNQAALNNLYGTGDGCSAYGNRNFWRIYNDWFGTTQTPDYTAQYIDVQNYTDATKSTSVPANSLNPGQRTYMVLRFKNIGNVTWHNTGAGVIRLNTQNASLSPFCDNSWVTCDRPSEMQEASVAPGGIASFEFWYKAPAVTANTVFSTRFGLRADPYGAASGTTQTQTTIVYAPVYTAQYIDVQNYTDATKAATVPANTLNPGQRTYMVLRFKNMGNMTWRNSGNGAVRTITQNTSSNPFCDTSWVSCNRPSEMKEAVVDPGGIASFEFWYKAPLVNTDTSFITSFGLVSDPVSTISGTAQIQTTMVHAAVYSAQYIDVQNYTDKTKTVTVPANSITQGQKTYMVLHFKNTGNFTWQNSGSGVIRVATLNTTNNPFCDTSSWIICSRPAAITESSVAPDGTATFEFWYKAPTVSSVSTFQTTFGVVSDFITTMTGTKQIQTTTVNP